MSDTQRSKRIKTVITLVTLFALVATTYALRDQISNTIDQLRDANPWPLLVVPIMALLNNYFQGKMYQSIFRILGDRFRTKPMVRISLELNLVNNVFPSAGVSGFSYLSIRMKHEGITTGKSTVVQGLRFGLLFVSMQVLLIVGLIALAIGGQANDFVILIAGSLATLLLVGTAILLYIISDRRRIDTFFTWLTRAANRIIHIVRPKHPETINIDRTRRTVFDFHDNYKNLRQNVPALRSPLLYGLGTTLTEVASIYAVFVAFGQYVNPGAVIIAYAVASFAGLISVLPGGVGIYEALMTGVFAAVGVPAALSLPVTIAYRILSMAVQLPPGYYYYQKALSEEHIPPPHK